MPNTTHPGIAAIRTIALVGQTTAGKTSLIEALLALMARADASGTWVLPWARPKLRADGPDRGVIHWAIIKPQTGAACALR